MIAVEAPTAPIQEFDATSLSNRLARVLQFAVDHLPRVPDYTPLWTEEEEEDGVVRMEDKIVAEAAILALVVSRVTAGDQAVEDLNGALVQILEKACSDERSLGILLRLPDRAAPLGLTEAILARLGHGNAEVQTVVRHLFEAGLVETVERLPYRAMEVRWVKSLLDPGSHPEVDDLIPLNVLVRPIHPITMNRMTAYGATHGIMYATDFGALHAPESINRKLASARIDAALAWVTANEDLDLLLELLISSVLLGNWSPYARAGWQVAKGVWDELGFIPSPSFDPSRYGSLQGDAAQAYAFRHVYHSIFVAGLLCAILLSGERTISIGPSSPPTLLTKDAARACMAAAQKAREFAAIEHVGKEGDWFAHPGERDLLPALSLIQGLLEAMLPTHLSWRKFLPNSALDPAELFLVLGDAAIIHAARQYDLPKLLRALDTRIARDDPPTLTVVEGALFLARQQLTDGCIGAQFVGSAERHSPAARETAGVVAECLGAYAKRLARAAD